MNLYDFALERRVTAAMAIGAGAFWFDGAYLELGGVPFVDYADDLERDDFVDALAGKLFCAVRDVQAAGLEPTLARVEARVVRLDYQRDTFFSDVLDDARVLRMLREGGGVFESPRECVDAVMRLRHLRLRREKLIAIDTTTMRSAA